ERQGAHQQAAAGPQAGQVIRAARSSGFSRPAFERPYRSASLRRPDAEPPEGGTPNLRGRGQKFLISGFLAFSLVLAISLAAQDWPQFLGPNRNGSISNAQLAASWPKEGPKALWQHPVGQGFAGPVVSGGKLIQFQRVDDLEVVECLDAQSGRVLWKKDYPTHYTDDFGFDPGPRATP